MDSRVKHGNDEKEGTGITAGAGGGTEDVFLTSSIFSALL